MAEPSDAVDVAAEAVRAGGLVVYPTETVYGLGADATRPEAIDRVFAAKERPRDRPLSMAVPDLAGAAEFVRLTAASRACIERFLPGPVTVVCPKRDVLPTALTGGRDRVGVRIPDHDLAQRLLGRVAPLTATSANPSGGQDVRHPDELAPSIRVAVETVIDGGRTPGGVSTVVDPDRAIVHRRGLQAEAVDGWLRTRE